MSLKGKTLRSRERNIVNNVREFFEKEGKSSSLSIPIHKAQERTAAATGVSLRTIQRIKKESMSAPDGKLSTPGKHRIRPAERNAVLDSFDLCVVRNTINEFYKTKKMPTISLLLPVLKEKINFSWKRETLRKILHEIGFRWKRCQNKRKLLIERPDIISWRCQYLREMKKHRQCQRNIVYVDETWIDNNLSFSKCWQDEKIGAIVNNNAGNRLIVVHAGSKEGFVPNADLVFKAGCATGDYHGQMNYDNFDKWIQEKLLPNIPSNSVVVMDNASYHTKILDPMPSKYSTKSKMCEYLDARNILYDKSLRKPELFNLIKANAPERKKYRIDVLLKEHGHSVLRLPPYHCDLNPIELAWAAIKRYVRERNAKADLSLKCLHELTSNAIKSVSSDDWRKYCTHVEKLETKYWDTDGIVEDVIETMNFDVESESETDTASEGGSIDWESDSTSYSENN